ncbi:MAG TPA: hypothetical protein PKC09_03925, partial [Paracoccus sp. (in: a-proteobacteria)]|nr:hypothetical protein [Paracoccus sp. (in: a-proteobacteria)]
MSSSRTAAPMAQVRGQSIVVATMLAVGLLVLAALYGRIMGYDLRRDEFMFVPPAALLDDHALYRDLFYNHVPYSAWLFRAVHQALPWLGLLAAARLTVFLAWLLLLGGAGWVGWRLTGSALVAAVGPLSLITADVLLGQTGMAATNNLLPLPFALLGLGFFAVALADPRPGFGQLLLAGVMLSVAAGMKGRPIALLPPEAIVFFVGPRHVPFFVPLLRVGL